MTLYRESVWDYLEEFARDLDKPYLVLDIAHKKIYDNINKQQERERLKKEITEDVLSRISVMLETGEALEKIKSLNEAIEQLGK